jgi:acetyltransferase-like isoleucine patch superfamily enzyme/acyl carrier protein
MTTTSTDSTSAVPPELLAVLTTLRPGHRPRHGHQHSPQHHRNRWTLETRLDDLGIDSLDRIRLAVALEATLGITIPDTALADADRVADLADLVTRHRVPDEAATAGLTGPTTEAVLPTPRSARDTHPDGGDDGGSEGGTDGGDTGFIHPTAELGQGACIGPGSKVWHYVQLAAGVRVGAHCTLGKGVYLGAGTRVGDRVKIQNAVNVFGATVHDEVMLCPGVLLVEDPTPRAVTADGARQGPGDWTARPVTVHRGATIGAGAVLLPGVHIGAHAMVAAGSVVSHDVPARALVAGNPHRQVGWVCPCGRRLAGGHCSCGAADPGPIGAPPGAGGMPPGVRRE